MSELRYWLLLKLASWMGLHSCLTSRDALTNQVRLVVFTVDTPLAYDVLRRVFAPVPVEEAPETSYWWDASPSERLH